MNYNTTDIENALCSLCPSAQWSYTVHSGEKLNYNDVEWNENNKIPKPTLEEIEVEIQRLQQEWEATEYQRLRAPEYPPLTELADALYWSSKGDTTKLQEYYDACEEVKNNHPKPY